MIKILAIILTLVFCTTCFSQYTKDSISIVKLLEKESATWRNGNIKEHASCWYIQPYSRILITRADSTFLEVPASVMLNPPKEIFGKGGYSVNSNYKMNIGKTNAWVTHNEVSVDKEGNKSYSVELRILEKFKNEWKLVGQVIHAYK